MQHIVVIDGHDAAGKTSICKRISELQGYQYIKPFSDTLGDLIAWLIFQKDFSLANRIALRTIEKAITENPMIATIYFNIHLFVLKSPLSAIDSLQCH